jgi:hypothetical protein
MIIVMLCYWVIFSMVLMWQHNGDLVLYGIGLGPLGQSSKLYSCILIVVSLFSNHMPDWLGLCLFLFLKQNSPSLLKKLR